jgi:hypothetical protein
MKRLATARIPDYAFKSENTWKKYLEERHIYLRRSHRAFCGVREDKRHSLAFLVFNSSPIKAAPKEVRQRFRAEVQCFMAKDWSGSRADRIPMLQSSCAATSRSSRQTSLPCSWRSREAVKRRVRVQVGSRDHTCGVDAEACGSLKLARPCAGSFESGYAAVGDTHEAEKHTARFRVGSRDVAGRVEAEGAGYPSLSMSLKASCFAIDSSHEAVKHKAHRKGGSRDRPG